MNTTDRAGTPGVPSPHPLGGFEERLLAELKFTVAGQATADPVAMRPGSGRMAGGAPKLAAAPRGSHTGIALTRRARVGAAAAGAIAAAAAVMVLLPGGPSTRLVRTEEQPLGGLSSHAARPVLLGMAATAGRGGVGTGRYWCTDTVEGKLVPIGTGGRELTPPGQGGQPSPASDYRYSVVTKHRMVECETPQGTDAGDFYQYLGARPATSADRAAWRRAGSPTSWRAWYANQAVSIHPGSLQKVGRTGGQAPWGSATSLPADPAKLRKALLTGLYGPSDVVTKRMERQTGLSYRQIEDQNLFWNLTGVLGEPIRPAVRAAAFRLLAQVPGGREVPGVRDPQGRAGTAVWWGQRDRPDGFLIIDPATTMVLASEGFAGTPAWVYKPDTMTDYQLTVSAGWVDRLPSSPPR